MSSENPLRPLALPFLMISVKNTQTFLNRALDSRDYVAAQVYGRSMMTILEELVHRQHISEDAAGEETTT